MESYDIQMTIYCCFEYEFVLTEKTEVPGVQTGSEKMYFLRN